MILYMLFFSYSQPVTFIESWLYTETYLKGIDHNLLDVDLVIVVVMILYMLFFSYFQPVTFIESWLYTETYFKGIDHNLLDVDLVIVVVAELKEMGV